MHPSTLYQQDRMLYDILYVPRQAQLIKVEIERPRQDRYILDHIIIVQESVERIIETAEWMENDRPRWAWIVQLPEGLVGGIIATAEPADHNGHYVNVVAAAALKVEKITHWMRGYISMAAPEFAAAFT